MKVAFLILTHKDPIHLGRLLNALKHPQVDFFIHVDKKANPKIFKKAAPLPSLENIQFIESRKVFWASISQTEARLDLIKAAIEKDNYSHLIMISGQCYPIKPIEQLLDFLKNKQGVSFMEHNKIPTEKLGVNKGLDRINCYSYSILGRKLTFFTKGMYTNFNPKGRLINIMLSFIHIFKKKRRFPANIKPYYGIDWWVLSNEAAKYILDYVKSNPTYHRYHKHTRHTCEVYFPSILAGSNFDGILENKSLHYMEWSKENTAHPIILTEKDFDVIQQTDEFFGRKFETKKSKCLLDLVDSRLLNINEK